MLTLKKAYSNYYYNSIAKCKLVKVLLLNFLKLNKELAYLVKLKADANKVEEDTFNIIVTARIKKERLYK
jgi:hypothetical protein